MLQNLRHRFSTLLNPDSEGFNPIPAAASLLDPTVAQLLLAPEYGKLLHAAKMYIVSMIEMENGRPSESLEQTPQNRPSGLNRFKFLASKLQAAREATTAGGGHQDTVLAQVNQYVADIAEDLVEEKFKFWAAKPSRYSKLWKLAEDLLSAPASQAYVERIFSFCGQLTAGRRNRMKKSLEMRAFLKLNPE